VNHRSILPLLALALAVPFVAKADTIDFSTFPYGPLSSADGVTFTLAGGNVGGTPAVGSFGTPSLGNSPTGNYPTSDQLIFTFSGPASGISAYFNNFGANFASTVTAYDGATPLSTTDIGGFDCDSGCDVTIPGSDVTSVVFDNHGSNWEYGVYTFTFTPGASTPEPSSLVLLGTGILGLAGAARRRFGK